MTLKELKGGGNLINEFKKIGFLDARSKQLLFYKKGDPTYCAIYELNGKFYFVHRVIGVELFKCFDYEDAMQRLRDFVKNAGL